MSNILSQLLSTPPAIKNTTAGIVVARGLKIVKVRIRLSSALMRHKTDIGSTEADARIIAPTVIEMDVIVPNVDTMNQVIAMTKDRGSFYQITSRGLIFNFMRVDMQDFNHSGEMLSATPMTLKFKQQLLEDISPGVFEIAGDSSLIDKGLSVLSGITSTATELASNIKTKITGFLG